MSWTIKCSSQQCSKESYAANVVELIHKCTDDDGWFRCSHCHSLGYIVKSFNLQERGEVWEPILRGAIPLGKRDDTYQPFVFLISYEVPGDVVDIWFSYYKDLRSSGGKLKLGYGPGGPPVLHYNQVFKMLNQLIRLGVISKTQLIEGLE